MINDTWGHSVGDVCLAAIADRLRRTLRPGDIAGRLGGEEFSIFLPGATVEQARAIGDRLCRTIAVEAEGADRDVRLTMSIGASFGESSTPLDRLMAQADRALYRAKAEGRARMVFWSDPVNDPPDPDIPLRYRLA
jgi:diguanylate cyclase (GGDEF)-like protein